MGAEACWRCGTAIDARAGVGRRDACLQCGSDLRCCRNCRFYEAAMHNECSEPQAERQVDKERGNFCDWFSLGRREEPAAASNVRGRLDELFKKG